MENEPKNLSSSKLVVVAVLAALIGLGVGYISSRDSWSSKMGYGNKENKYRLENRAENNTGGMHGAMQGMMVGLSGKTGDELDKAFLEQMIVHHEGAVEMAKTIIAGTNRAELKKLAEEIITAQTKEIEMMRGWLNSWYPNNN